MQWPKVESLMAGTNRLSVVEDRSIFVETWCLHTVDCLCTVKVGEHQHYWFIIIIIFMLCICNVRRKSVCCQVISCQLIFDVIKMLVERFTEKDIELLHHIVKGIVVAHSHMQSTHVQYKFCTSFVQNLYKTCAKRAQSGVPYNCYK